MVTRICETVKKNKYTRVGRERERERERGRERERWGRRRRG